MDHDRVLWITEAYKACLGRLVRQVEAGMSLSVAWEIAYRDLDNEYRKLCLLETIPAENHMLDPATVEMFARFGLDAVFGAQVGGCDESDQRKAFWQVFRRVTSPTTHAVMPIPEGKKAGAVQQSAH